jgi:hypothetical protein
MLVAVASSGTNPGTAFNEIDPKDARSPNRKISNRREPSQQTNCDALRDDQLVVDRQEGSKLWSRFTIRVKTRGFS